MLTKRYLISTKNLNAILKKMVDGVAPDNFNYEHLRSIGFASSSDRGVIPLLKDLGYLAADGTPTPRYQAYRDRSRSNAVMAEALREAYADIFRIREFPTAADRPAIEGLFRSKLNSTDKIAQLQAMTFFGLLKHADLRTPTASGTTSSPMRVVDTSAEEIAADGDVPANALARPPLKPELHYTIQIHLPATKDIEVFNAIFQSLRSNLLS